MRGDFMYKAVYPGSFDPLTKGHLEIIERVSKLYDKVYVLIADNVNKKTIFTDKERIEMLKLVTKNLKNVIVDKTDGLVVDYCLKNNISVIIRGLRNINDYENERQLFHFNYNISNKIETVLLFPTSLMSFVSSSAIKELIAHDADITPYVPRELINQIKEKLNHSK